MKKNRKNIVNSIKNDLYKKQKKHS